MEQGIKLFKKKNEESKAMHNPSWVLLLLLLLLISFSLWVKDTLKPIITWRICFSLKYVKIWMDTDDLKIYGFSLSIKKHKKL